MSTAREKAQVVLLETDKLSSDIWSNKGRRLYFNQANFNEVEDQINYEIYILSSEKIKEGDWCINMYNLNNNPDNLHQCVDDSCSRTYKQNCKKVAVTTDVSLGLSQPSEEFVEHYIEECNKGNVITEVFVEYEEVNVVKLTKELFNQIDSHTSMINYPIDRKEKGKLKVFKDNTIKIHPVKNSWNRKEHISDIKKLFNHIKDVNGYQGIDMDKWIEENI